MSIELPPLITTSFGFNEVGEKIPSQCDADSVEARERILLARIAELHKDLADCFRLTGADPDGNEDWRLSRDAVKEVAAMRADLDLAEARIAQLEHMWREAEDRALCAEEAAMSHAARIIELEKKYEQAPS